MGKWAHDWPIRWQLTAFYAALLLITLSVLGLLLYTRLEGFLIGDAEARLEREVEQSLSQGGIPNGVIPDPQPDGGTAPKPVPVLDMTAIKASSVLVSAFEGRDSHGAVYDRSGAVVLESETAFKVPPWPAPPPKLFKSALAGKGGYVVDASRQPRVLILAKPIRWHDQTLAVACVSVSLESLDAMLNALKLYLVLGGMAALLVGVVAGVPLTRRLLRPLDRVARTATEIAAGDSTRRVGLAGRRNEVAQVAGAFDRMVDQLNATLQAQRQFVADASHELRTPLTALGGLSEMLLLGIDEDDVATRQQLLRRLNGEIERLNRLVANLLSLSRLDAGARLKRVELDLTALVSEVLEGVRPSHPDRLLTGPDGEAVTVTGDSDQLRQVAWNLIDNALKYTPPGGHVRVDVRPAGDWAEMVVADEGEGIPPEALPHVFDRFYRVDKSRARRVGGVGLGLAIASAIVQAHGGIISATSPGLGHGSIFTVRLPRDHHRLPSPVTALASAEQVEFPQTQP